MATRLRAYTGFLLLFLLFIAGCSGGGGGTSTASDSGGGGGLAVVDNAPPTTVSTATIRLEMVLERSIPASVSQIRLTGYATNGEVRYGPVVRSKSPAMEFENVPVDCTQVQLELLGQSRVLGIGRVQVRLSPGEIFLIFDPDFEDVEAVLTGLSLEPSSLQLAAGTSGVFRAVGRYNDGSVLDLSSSASWTSSSNAIEVDASGNVQTFSKGEFQVEAGFGPFTASGSVIVTDAELTEIRLEPAVFSLPSGLSEPTVVTAIFTDSSQQDVTDAADVSVSPPQLGVWDPTTGVTALATGSGTVSAVFQGKTAQATLTVSPAVLERIEISPENPATPNGLSTQLVATGHYSDGSTEDLSGSVSWTSQSPGVCTVALGGMATGHSLGDALIQATLNNVTGETTLTVTEATLQRVTLTPSTNLPLGLTQQLLLLAHYSDGSSVDVTSEAIFSSDNASVVSVTTLAPRGVAKAHIVGVANITGSFGGAEDSVQINAIPAILKSISITPGDLEIPKGLTQQYYAEGTYSDETTRNLTDQVAWVVQPGTIAQVDSLGLLAALSIGPATIEASLDGVSATEDVTVLPPAIIGLEISPKNDSLVAGESLQFNLTATLSDGTSLPVHANANWTSNAPEVASISNDGLLSTHKEGNVAITATFGGHQDVASIEVFRLITGEGFFSAPVFGTQAVEIDIADLNGDNFPDAVSTYTNDSFIQMRFNDGSGRLSTESNIELASNLRVKDFRLGNIDGDNDLDLIVSETIGRKLLVYQNNGSGGFSNIETLSLAGDYPVKFELIDMDGNNSLDILLEYSASGTRIGYFPNNGFGHYGNLQPVSLSLSDPSIWGILDFDGINGPDIVWLEGANSYYVSLNNGDGTFSAPFMLLNNVNYKSISLGDWDQDGFTDLAYTAWDNVDTVFTLLNDGSNNFTPVAQYQTGKYARLAAPVDVNGDNTPDLISMTANTNESHLLIGNKDGTFQPPIPMIGEIRDVGAADIDGDNDIDLVGGSDLGFLVYFNRNGFEPASINLSTEENVRLTSGDFNRDGHLDIAALDSTQYGPYQGHLYMNDGNGYFSPGNSFVAGQSGSSIVSADFNGDGRIDIATSSISSYTRGLYVSLASGSGTTFQSSYYQTDDSFYALAKGDFDGDLDIDLVGVKNGTILFFKNNGSGQFSPQPNIDGGQNPRQLLAVDVDGDRALDIVATTGDNRLTVIKNKGDGTFEPPQTSNTGEAAPALLGGGDIDGDGDIDIAVVHTGYPVKTVVMKNDGEGNFSPTQTFTEYRFSQPLLLDVDHDEDVDLISGPLRRNDGTGQFDSPQNHIFTIRFSAEPGDFDSDGDPDLVSVETYYVHAKGLYLYRNYPLPGTGE